MPSNCTPNGEQLINSEKIHTDKEIAKRTGLGTGTVARYNKVMNSDDDELKEKVKTGKVKIGTDITNGKAVALQMEGE